MRILIDPDSTSTNFVMLGVCVLFSERARRCQERAEVDVQDGGRRLQLRPRRRTGDPRVLRTGQLHSRVESC